MEHDYYTTDDRRYARVIPPDDGESSSGSSYAGSDASSPSARSPVNMLKAGIVPPASQLSVEANATVTSNVESTVYATEAENGIQPAPQMAPDLSLHPNHGIASAYFRMDQEREEDLSVIGSHHASGSATDECTLSHGSAQEGTLNHPGKDRRDAANEASRPFEDSLGDVIPSRDDDSHSALEDLNNLVLRMNVQENDGGASEGAIPNREIGRGSRAEASRMTTLSAGSAPSGRRSPPLERARSDSVESNRNIREIILPRWQPDAEVTYCPICRTQFSFFVRKHHCRRCGRVVCNACSPHRITIPYQFIVQPPPVVAVPSTVSMSESGANASSHTINTTSSFSERNGGMKVRLCNPCVPDPNPLPPQPQYSDMSGQIPTVYLNSGSRPYSFTEDSTTGGSGRARGLSTASGLGSSGQRARQRSISPYNGHTGSTISNSGSNPLFPNVQTGRYSGYLPRPDPLRVAGSSTSSASHFSQSSSRAHSSQSRGHASRHQSLSFIPGGSNSSPQPHYRSLLDVGSDQYARTSSSNRPLPPVPRVNEEEECPVCHRVLFPSTLPDLENRRAAHIMQCIDEQIALHSGASPRPGAHGPPSRRQSPPSQAARQPSPHRPPSSPAARPTLAAAAPEAARRTGMFVYRASEKDCVDEAECSICLEEFEVGASMARLECFCRFHRKCIRDWFVDHPGRCPVHQHDGYGF